MGMVELFPEGIQACQADSQYKGGIDWIEASKIGLRRLTQNVRDGASALELLDSLPGKPNICEPPAPLLYLRNVSLWHRSILDRSVRRDERLQRPRSEATSQ